MAIQNHRVLLMMTMVRSSCNRKDVRYKRADDGLLMLIPAVQLKDASVNAVYYLSYLQTKSLRAQHMGLSTRSLYESGTLFCL